jgi:hypothetical protein
LTTEQKPKIKELPIDNETYAKLEVRAKEKGQSVDEYVVDLIHTFAKSSKLNVLSTNPNNPLSAKAEKQGLTVDQFAEQLLEKEAGAMRNEKSQEQKN